ncbi:hypothetical protein BZA05DRAFT_393380 [Tricharina praecox]|uniref:uncharacterized protein n=1 Tax=Tricharina praecox TaxID=43433 RepID=UPI002220A256|nr:uncharacterized protein BZA05DRAFT_393380 [Tricharina praecox]KAI5854157.1 hypothetical protein BZA05DRAFT_393380 [Tricharina praecox]
MAILTPTHASTIHPPITAAELSLLRPNFALPPTPAAPSAAIPSAAIPPVRAPKPSTTARDPRGPPGTRRRQRWENARLVGNPAFVAPSAGDWAPGATHAHKRVHYEFACLWAGIEAGRSAEENEREKERKMVEAAAVPREIRRRLKKAPCARVLLESLEREVIEFLRAEDAAVEEEEGFVLVNEDEDSEEDEIVFVGRGRRGVQHAAPGADAQREKVKVVEKVLLASAEEDRGAGFGRWLLHSIAQYYGLQSWSVTEGCPRMRYAYVAKTVRGDGSGMGVKRPLYLMV